MAEIDTTEAVARYLRDRQPADVARASMGLAVGVNPDQEGEFRRLSAQSGLPVDTVKSEPDTAKQAAAIKATDFAELADRFPSTTAYLGGLDNARIAHDDVGNLRGIENTLKEWRGPQPTAGSVASGLAQSIPQGFRSMRQGMSAQMADLLDWAGIAPMDEVQRAEVKRLSAQAAGASDYTTPDFDSSTAKAVYGGVQSTLSMLPSLGLSLATGTPLPVLAYAGMQSETQAYAKYRGRGASPGMSLVGAAGEGAVEVGTEMIPMGYLVGQLGKAGVKEFVAGMLAREAPTEQIATFLQDAIDTAIANPDKTWGEFAQERPDAAYQTLIATLTQSAIMGGAHAGIKRIAGQDQAAARATQSSEALQSLNDLAAASKVRGRDTQSFKAFVESASQEGPVQDLYIDPRALAQSGISAQELSAISASVAEQLPTAIASGSDIRIPTAEFAANIAGTPIGEQMLPHLKTEVDGMSQKEADAYMAEHGQTLQGEVDAALSQQEGNAAFKASRDAVQANIAGQLAATGRFTEDVNKPYAALVAARYGTLANQLGMTPEEVFAQYPLRVASEGLGGLSQSAIDTPEFKNWFKRSAVIDRQGAPIEVYHGTAADFSVFDRKMIGANYGEDRKGFFFTNDPEQAAKAARDAASNGVDTAPSVMAVYLSIQNPLTLSAPDGEDAMFFLDENKKKILARAARAKADGIIVNGPEGDSVYVVFDPARVKSATGNNGQFDLKNPSILAQGESTPRATFNPDTRTISLLAGANLSSFLHESGHLFLDMQAAIAAQPNAPQPVIDDMAKLLDWFGIKDSPEAPALDRWHAMSLDEQRESHEKFARGFEAYLFEGKAPNVELQGVFARFRAWMLNVYASLKGLNVTLTDDVRGVMDRMLATEQEIETAEAARSMGMMFKTPAEAESFGVKWAAYQELGTQATDDAISKLGARSLKDMQWLTNAKGRILKQLQKDAAEKRREVRAEVRTEVMSQPIYRAWTFLTGKAPKADELSEPEIEHRREVKDHKQKRVEAKADAAKTERATLLATAPELKGLQKGQLLAKNKRQIDINVQQRMLEWDQANRAPAAPDVADHPIAPGFEVGKLDKKSVEAIDKKLAADLSARRMLRADAMAPDVVAEQFGFTSGEQLVRALALADTPQEAVEALTDQRMLERYGDLTSQEAIDRAANEAIHNAARQRMVATELKALEDANKVTQEGKNGLYGRTPSIATLPKAAKQFAEQIIARLKVKDIRPQQYTAAEARATRASTKALKAGDIAAAAVEKRNQLVNGYAATAANDALAEVRDMLVFFRRVTTGSKENIAKSRDVDMVMAMRAILAEYGIGTRGEAAQEYMQAVQRNDPSTYAVLKDKVDAMTAAGQPYTEVSMEKLRGLHDELRGMWHLARRGRQVEIDGALVDREMVQAQLVARMDELGVPARVPGEGMSVTDAERRLTKLQTLRAALRRVESWVGAKDGSEAMGPFRRNVWNPIKDAADAYRTDKAKYLRRYRDLLKTVDLGQSRIAAPELGYTFGHSRGGSGKQEILHALLHTGNESNKRKLLLGRNWASALDDNTVDTSRWDGFVSRMINVGVLTKADFDFAQGVWDLLEEMKPGAQKTHRDVFGNYFDEVTADAFTNKFGSYRGGYVPAMTDSEVVKDAATRSLQEEENQTLAYAFPATSKGFTKARVEYNKPLLLDLRALSQHIDKVLLFTHLEQPIRDVRKILTANEVAEPLHRIDPTAFDGLLTPWMNRTARQSVESPVPGSNGLMRFFSVIRARAGVAAMVANLSNTAQQITGLSIAAIKVGPGQLLSATGQYIHSPQATAKAVAAASAYMATRMDNEVAQMNDAISDILLNPNVYEKAQSWTMKHAYFMQAAFDNVLGPIIWTGAYNQALESGQTERDAIRLADSAVRETQGSTLAEDVSRIETGNAFVRMFTQFAGYFNMQANLLGSEFAKLQHEAGLRKGMGRGLYVFTLGFLAPALVSELIVQAFRGGPDDEDKDGSYLDDWLAALGMGVVRAGLGMAPGLGQAINAGINTFNKKPYDDRFSTSPAVSMIESAVSVPHSVYAAVTGDGSAKKAIRDVATLISMTTGLPANAITRPILYGVQWANGDVQPTGVMDAARGFATGLPSPESKR